VHTQPLPNTPTSNPPPKHTHKHPPPHPTPHTPWTPRASKPLSAAPLKEAVRQAEGENSYVTNK